MSYVVSCKQAVFYTLYKEYLGNNNAVDIRIVSEKISSLKEFFELAQQPIQLDYNQIEITKILQDSKEYFNQIKPNVFSLTEKGKEIQSLKEMVRDLPNRKSYRIIRGYLKLGDIERSKLFPDRPYIPRTRVGEIITKEEIEMNERIRIAEYIHYVQLTNRSRSDKKEMLRGVIKNEKEIEEILNRELPIFD